MFSLEKSQEKELDVRYFLKGSGCEEISLKEFLCSESPVTEDIQAKTVQSHVRNIAGGFHSSQVSILGDLLLKYNKLLELG